MSYALFKISQGEKGIVEKSYFERSGVYLLLIEINLIMNRKHRIESQLNEYLKPVYLDVVDESHRHHVPENAQTHYKVTAVSEAFSGMSLIKRHRLVNEFLASEFEEGMHALSLHLKTPSEWDAQSTTPNSPACRDGFKHG